MEKRLVVKRIISTVLIIIMTTSMSVISVFATDTSGNQNEIKENVAVGEKFFNSDGVLEQVIRINNDGSFITEEVRRNNMISRKVTCTHPAASLVAIANLSDESRAVGTSSCCFKYRSVTQCRCKKCGRTVKTYGAWEYYKKHTYSLFGKTCNLCGYKK